MIWACIRSKWRRISRWRSHQEWAGFAAPYAPGVDAQSVLTLRYPNDVLATLRMGLPATRLA